MKIKRLGTYITGFKYYKYKAGDDLGGEITDEDTINKIKKFKI